MNESKANAFMPSPWLRNPHVQSVLASSKWRKLAARRLSPRLESAAEEFILDGGKGVRLQGFLTRQNIAAEARGLIVLLHGWEGRVDSNYVLHTGAALLESGFDVFRLHFRDHGDTHALNQGLFHSCLIEEVVGALDDLSRRVPHRGMGVAGYSLGGNFALRTALHAPQAGVMLKHVAAVCPVISPRAGMDAIEMAPWFYERYFTYKWSRSLKRKQAIYPETYRFSPDDFKSGVRGMSQLLIQRHTEFSNLDEYFDGYSVAGDRLARLEVPVSILTAADDPIIPVADFHRLQLPAHSQLQIVDFGGHCGFITDISMRGFAEQWITEKMLSHF